MSKTRLSALLGIALLVGAGCSLHLDLVGARDLNVRPTTTGHTEEQNSDLVTVKIFQLRSVALEQRRALIEQIRTEWPQIREQSILTAQVGPTQPGVFPESIKPLLVYDAKLLTGDRPTETFIVSPGSAKRYAIPTRFQTSHLLVITLGHTLGPASVQLVNVSSSEPVSLCFYEYDVYPAAAETTSPCNRGLP